MLFNVSLLVVTNFVLMNYAIKSPSFILFFLFTHCFVFTPFTLVTPLLYSVTYFFHWAQKELAQSHSISASCYDVKLTINKIIDGLGMQGFSRVLKECYSDKLQQSEHYFLSGKFNKATLIISYTVSGILTASNMSNNFIFKYMKDLYAKSTVFKDLYVNDLKLYTQIFLVSFISVVVANCFSKSKNS